MTADESRELLPSIARCYRNRRHMVASRVEYCIVASTGVQLP